MQWDSHTKGRIHTSPEMVFVKWSQYNVPLLWKVKITTGMMIEYKGEENKVRFEAQLW